MRGAIEERVVFHGTPGAPLTREHTVRLAQDTFGISRSAHVRYQIEELRSLGRGRVSSEVWDLQPPLWRSVMMESNGTQEVETRQNVVDDETGAIGYIAAWLLGVPATLLFVIFILRGCN